MDEFPDVPRHSPDPAHPEPMMLDRPRPGGLALRAARVAARHAPAYVVIDADYQVLLFSGRTGRFLEPAGAATLALLALVHRDLRLDLGAALHRASATGQVVRRERLPVSSGNGRILVNIVVEPMATGRDDAGCFVVLFHDIGADPDADGAARAQRVAEARQQLLLAEQLHRVKNILAVVRSVMTRTMESAGAPEMLTAHLSGRIGALARTQAVLARTSDGAVPLEELVREELAAHGGQDERQYVVEGPAVLLGEKSAEILGLALHELVTNALKFGALSTPLGRLLVLWRIDAGGTAAHRAEGTMRRLILAWEESGVPITDLEPGRTGFGRELIEQGLPYELGASTALAFRPGGVRCVIELPLDPHTGGAPIGEATE